jgi:hypothetical protein
MEKRIAGQQQKGVRRQPTHAGRDNLRQQARRFDIDSWAIRLFPFRSAERTARGKGNMRTINPEWPKVGSIDSPVTLET